MATTFRQQLAEIHERFIAAGDATEDTLIDQIEQAVLELVKRALPEAATYWTNDHGHTRRDSYAEKAYRKGRDDFYYALVSELRGNQAKDD